MSRKNTDPFRIVMPAALRASGLRRVHQKKVTWLPAHECIRRPNGPRSISIRCSTVSALIAAAVMFVSMFIYIPVHADEAILPVIEV